MTNLTLAFSRLITKYEERPRKLFVTTNQNKPYAELTATSGARMGPLFCPNPSGTWHDLHQRKMIAVVEADSTSNFFHRRANRSAGRLLQFLSAREGVHCLDNKT